MTKNDGWKIKTYDNGQEVLLKTIQCQDLEQSYGFAVKVAESLVGSEAENDFSVSADPSAVFIVLHAYSKGELPSSYTLIAKKLDRTLNC